VGKPETLASALLNWRRFAGIPRREAYKLIDQTERDDQDRCIEPAQLAGHGYQISQNPG